MFICFPIQESFNSSGIGIKKELKKKHYKMRKFYWKMFCHFIKKCLM